MRAWHFTAGTLRDGRPIPADGELLRHDGPLVMCESGLHASRRAIDALGYAPGPTACRVEVGGEILEDSDKLATSERTILWRVDATDTLRKFARLCALDVIHLWDAPEVVVRYLRTGDESLRSAAESAARSAAEPAAESAAESAARSAAWSAAWSAAESAAWSAAWSAARSATWSAARSAQNRRLERMLHEAHRRARKANKETP